MNTSYILWQEDDGFVIRSLEYPVVTQGDTKEDAIRSLKEALELYLEDEIPATNKVKNAELGRLILHY